MMRGLAEMPISRDIERIVFVGVIHTDTQSVERARKAVHNNAPDVVAVELDRDRYRQLMNPEATRTIIEHTNPTGDTVQDLMQQIASLELQLGDMTGSPAGEEMMAAIDEGRKISAKIALVDRPIQATAQALMRVPLDELYRLMGMLPEATKDIQDEGVLSLMSMLKEDGAVENMMGEFRKQFPNVTAALIEQRDEYVARALCTILDDVPGKIVVVLGAGHLQGVKAALERMLRVSSAS